jgi:hypothetical protein
VNVAALPARTVASCGGIEIDGPTTTGPTVRTAPVLVAVPPALLTTTSKMAPESVKAADGITKLALFAPPIATLFLRHWNCSGAVPIAATVKVAEPPTSTKVVCGCPVMVGASALTLSVASELVTLPAELVTTTENCAPWSAIVVAGIEKLEDVAPAIAWPPRCHWNPSGPEPLAVTLKLAVCPSSTVTAIG